MRDYIRRAVVGGALLAAASAPLLAQEQGLSKDQVATIEQEVTAALQRYYRLYTEKNSEALGATVFLEPWFQLGANGAQANHTEPKEVAQRFAGNVERLEAQGWVKSEYPKPIVCVINGGTAIASGEFMRYRKDGSVISVNGTSYLFTRTKEGWRIVAFFGHERGKIIGCSDGL